MTKRIAIINQRYGLEVNGGSEVHARMLAERLSVHYNVEVLTTCALEYTTWENHYNEGIHNINGVCVRRFSVDKPRDTLRFNEISMKVLTKELNDTKTEQEWVDEQGPYCPKLIDYISENENEYDVFIFVTYLYYLTVRGIGIVSKKALLVPTAHDEPPIYLNVYKEVFLCPQAIAFNTEEEQSFIYKLFDNRGIPNEIIGVGIDVPSSVKPDKFRVQHGVDNYILYVGRIDENKGCAELFSFFSEYKEKNPSDLKLVLMGNEIMSMPHNPEIISLGFVSEEVKFDGMSGAKLLIMPSAYESLSIVVLESMALEVPVVVNGKCEVLRVHCKKSNAGLFYLSYDEFEGCMNYIYKHDDEYTIMKKNARIYVEQNYRWDLIITKLMHMIDVISA